MATLEETIGYSFRNAHLLKEALTHSSVSRAGQKAVFNNQRLEFLGDAVLGIVVSHLLFTLYPTDAEGALARRLAALVRGDTLAEVAAQLGMGEFVILSEAEESAGGRTSVTILEDVCEALIGAIYLDGGYDAAKKFVLTHWQARAEAITKPPKDAKSALQEWAQGRGLPLPSYSVLTSEGPAHAPTFTIEVAVQGIGSARASASAKRAAEQLAAVELLQHIKQNYDE